MKKCLAIVAYDRSDYFLQCLSSVQGNGSDIDKFVFIDGGPDSIYESFDKEFWENIEDLGYTVIPQSKNLGIAHHLFYIRDLICTAGYDYFIILEEDVVVSPSFIDVTCNLAEWAFTNFDDIGVVTTWNMCKESKEWKEANLDKVEVTNCNWITYAMSARCWGMIRPKMKEYIDKFIQKGNYRARPHGEIRKWYIEEFGTPPKEMEGNLYPEITGAFWPYGHISTGRWPSSQDGCMVGALGKERLRKIGTLVNHCKYIGKIGQHGTPSTFANAGFGDVELINFESARKIKIFRPKEG